MNSRNENGRNGPIELTDLDHEGNPKSATTPEEITPPTQYPRGVRLVLITIGLVLSIFLAALDSTIIVAGMGGGGVMTGSFIIIAMTAGPEYRAAYMGVLGVTFGCASVVGPLMGGALTDGPGWPWCFWISLPIGLSAGLTMLLCFNNPSKPKDTLLVEKLLNLDLNGAILLSGCFSCFVLAMHWIGIMPWTGSRVVGSFAGSAALFLCFVINEWVMGDKAMVRAHLFRNNLVLANLIYVFFLAGAFFPLMYTLPTQFQSVNNTTASQSGVRLIPLVMGVSVFTMISNGLLTFWRHYKPFFLVGALFTIAGNAKIYTLDASTPTKDWIGYEIVTAIGVGLALQIPMIANQTLVPADDLGAVTAMTLFMENCGTVLFLASSEAAFTNGLLSSLARNLPEVDSRVVLDAGATQIRSLFSGKELDNILVGYLEGCKTSHIIAVVCGAMAGVISLTNAGPAAIREAKLRLKKSHER